jgi:hypothetical protein
MKCKDINIINSVLWDLVPANAVKQEVQILNWSSRKFGWMGVKMAVV